MKKRAKTSEEEKKEKITSAVLVGPQVYAIGAVGKWTSYDFRIGFYSDIQKKENGDNEYIFKTQVILTPRATKELSEWLADNVAQYEKEHGIIKTTKMLKEEE